MEKILLAFNNKISQWKKRYEDELILELEHLYGDEITQAIVFNESLLTANPSKVKYILVGDNPGFEEQLNGKYLSGDVGKKVKKFFTETGLVKVFKEEVLILNKTPFFTKRTNHLNSFYTEEYCGYLIESQEFMAQLVFDLHLKKRDIKVWIIGFAGCRDTDGKWLKIQQNGTHYYQHQLLPYFFEQLKSCYRESDMEFKIFKHFSFNHFLNDIKGYENMNKNSLTKLLNTIGGDYHNELMSE